VRINARQQPLSELAKVLQIGGPDVPPVVDKTLFTGQYTFTLEYTRDFPGATPSDPPPALLCRRRYNSSSDYSLFSKKLPFGLVVVESIHQVPAEN
jgi:uncharacterized protein (TIGR03435 family)